MMTDAVEIRKDVMGPRIGLFSGLMILVLITGQTALAPHVLEGLGDLRAQVWVGLMWAGWALSLWIFATRPITLPRIVVLGGLFVWHSWWMSVLREQPIHRYWIMLGFFALTFAVAEQILALPVWRNWTRFGLFSPAERPRRGQFGILAILTTTLAVAILMYAVKQYDDGDRRFVQGTIVVSCLLVGMAHLGIHSGISWPYPWLGLPVLIVVGWSASWLLALQDQRELSTIGTLDTLWPVYQIIVTVFGVAIWGIAFCGRSDGRVFLRDEAPAESRHLDKQTDP